MISLLFFLISLLCLCAFINYDKNKSKEKYLYYFLVIFFTLISGLRYEVGADFHNYEIMYEQPEHPLNNFIEPSWIIISKIFHYFNFESVSWFLFTSFVINLNILKTLFRYSKYFIISLILYVSTVQLFYQSMNVVRQYFAISIIFGFINLYIEKKYFKFLIVILIASLFHISALITIPFFLIATLRIPSAVLALTLMISYLVRNRMLSIIKQVLSFSPSYAGYATHLVAAKTTSGLYILMLLVFGLSFIYFFRNTKVCYKWLNLTIISFSIYISFISFEAGQRINLYFLPSLMILLSYIPSKKDFDFKIIYTMSIISGFIMFYYKATNSISYRMR